MSIKCPVLGVLSIPGKVLRGSPWTAEKLALLRLLRQGLRAEGCRPLDNDLDDDNVDGREILSIPAADLFEGMASAMREHNQTALLTLLELHQGVAENVRRELPVALFHLATKAGKLSTIFLWLLVKTDIRAVPVNDEVLTAWAVRAGAASTFGRWLLRMMENGGRELPSSQQGGGWFLEGEPFEEQVHGRELVSCDHLWEAVGYVHESSQPCSATGGR